MAVVGLLSAREPTLTLPDITLTLALLNNCHPPIDQEKYHDTNDPLEEHQNKIEPTKTKNQKQPCLLSTLDS